MTATLALADRLARLERTVASLQNQLPGAEALQPNYLTIAADGTIGADFSGKINAEGLEFDLLTGSAGPGIEIIWKRTDTGFVIASINGQSVAGTPNLETLNLQARAAATGEQVQLAFDAVNLIGQLLGSLTFNGLDGGAGSDQAWTFTAGIPGAAKRATVLAGDGSSSFLQLLSAQQLQLAVGPGTVTWSGTSQFANATQAHGLGRTPKWAAGTPLNQFGGGWYLMLNGLDATNLTFQAQAPTFTPAARTDTFYWLAIG